MATVRHCPNCGPRQKHDWEMDSGLTPDHPPRAYCVWCGADLIAKADGDG